MAEGMRAYQCYMALKLHFTSDYNYFKYLGRTRQISESAFEARKDHLHFARLERRYQNKLEEFFVANFVCNPDAKWVGDLCNVKAEKAYLEWRKRMQSLKYNFKQDLLIITEEIPLCPIYKAFFSDATIIQDGQHPSLLRMFIGNKISIETMIILEAMTPWGSYLNGWDQELTDPIWPEYSRKIRKYAPFLRIKKEDFYPVYNEVCSLQK